MSERICSNNLEEVVKQNRIIRDEIFRKTITVKTECNNLRLASSGQLAFQILKSNGLIQMPVEDLYFSGAIFVKHEAKIPFINTALPRANQYFTAWHEIYHLLFDSIQFDHIINTESVLEERKAEYFASLMLLGDVMPFYRSLPEMSFPAKVFHCMDAFQAPYKAVLISLYEAAMEVENTAVMNEVRKYFNLDLADISKQFIKMGLDDSLVKPSNVINCDGLYGKIERKIIEYPELHYHKDNATYVDNLVNEMMLLTGENVDEITAVELLSWGIESGVT